MSNRLKVAPAARIFNNLPVWAAREFGYYSDAGIEGTIDVLFSGGKVGDALRSGVDAAAGTPESVLGDTSDPQELLIVGGNAGKVANRLVARRGIERIEDLRGGTTGVFHPTEGTALLVTELPACGACVWAWTTPSSRLARVVAHPGQDAGRRTADIAAQVPRGRRGVPQPRRHCRHRARPPVHDVQRPPGMGGITRGGSRTSRCA
jgi:hypothetical protein